MKFDFVSLDEADKVFSTLDVMAVFILPCEIIAYRCVPQRADNAAKVSSRRCLVPLRPFASVAARSLHLHQFAFGSALDLGGSHQFFLSLRLGCSFF